MLTLRSVRAPEPVPATHAEGERPHRVRQHLRPTPRHLAAARWLPPDEFAEIAAEAEWIGFAGVLAGPLVRSCYRAGRPWARSAVAQGREVPDHLRHLADAALGVALARA